MFCCCSLFPSRLALELTRINCLVNILSNTTMFSPDYRVSCINSMLYYTIYYIILYTILYYIRLPDVFCLMVRIFHLMLVLLHIYMYVDLMMVVSTETCCLIELIHDTPVTGTKYCCVWWYIKQTDYLTQRYGKY
jgi:hypothetical protein